ncbi:hypothetical protein [Metabacillus halosaccharovorans]|uniref:Uncharacterized protein n=1 Tax=Metabacillus halosaccharovorans TaxID=930124 RepID=A0ABT3DGR7_9BACI|nr:hypothetical protein [Metabacillus halosaccharovorans]MCV9885867.1 hypothetical protein [Metabacillus halosaccharovorans]
MRKTAKKKGNKERTIIKLFRPIFIIVFCLLIVHVYYLSTIDQLVPQLMKLSAALIMFAKSIPTSILLVFGYTLVIFYAGYIVGKKLKS